VLSHGKNKSRLRTGQAAPKSIVYRFREKNLFHLAKKKSLLFWCPLDVSTRESIVDVLEIEKNRTPRSRQRRVPLGPLQFPGRRMVLARPEPVSWLSGPARWSCFRWKGTLGIGRNANTQRGDTQQKIENDVVDRTLDTGWDGVGVDWFAVIQLFLKLLSTRVKNAHSPTPATSHHGKCTQGPVSPRYVTAAAGPQRQPPPKRGRTRKLQ